MSVKEKFDAAVNVIRNLPKNGSYQPSHALMLDFYAYYKQATEGWENRGDRPGFLNLVGRAKWDAWNRLGQMPREEAMQRYVDELNKVSEKIVETMSLTDNVAEFLSSMEGSAEDLELCIGPVLEKMRSQPGSPLSSRDTSPIRAPQSQIASVPEADEEDEEYLETLENVDVVEPLNRPSTKEVKRKDTPAIMPSRYGGHYVNGTHVDQRSLSNGYLPHKAHHIDTVSEALQKAVDSLRKDLAAANDKVRSLEERQKKLSSQSIVHLRNMSPRTIAFIVLWPVALNLLLNWMRRRSRAH